VRAGQVVHDLLDRFLGRRGADGGTRARAQPLGHLGAHLDLLGRVRLLESLRVGVGDDELDPLELLLDHVVHRIAAGAAHAEHGDPGLEIFLPRKRKIECHRAVRLF
jgi:hypothetical protein